MRGPKRPGPSLNLAGKYVFPRPKHINQEEKYLFPPKKHLFRRGIYVFPSLIYAFLQKNNLILSFPQLRVAFSEVALDDAGCLVSKQLEEVHVP